MFSELCRETLRRAVAHGYLGYIISLRDQLQLEEEEGDSSDEDCAGATPVDSKQNGRPTSAKQGPSWLSEDLNAELSPEEGKDGQSQVDREERLRILREKQNEERQRKLDELKQQALAAQKFREQKEEERRRRLEELRVRDTDRRHQVEERKRQIWEAERDRREAILRKNQEREARIESKRKNERSSIVFAFGSSTPRMLEPGDTGSTYWATRRATSTSNVMTLSLSATQPGPLTRRSSERELDGSKKRATSAGGIERKTQDRLRMSSSIYEVFQWGVPPPASPNSQKPLNPFFKPETEVRRRKTDLTPTVPERDSTPPPRKGKPGRAYSMSRLDILSQPRAAPKPLLPAEPLRRGTARSMVSLGPPRPTRAERLRRKAREQQARSQSLDQPSSPGARSGDITPSRPQSSLSQHSVSSQLSAASLRARTPRRPRPVSIAVTGVSSPGSDRSVKSPNVSAIEKPPIPKVHATKKPITNKMETTPKKPAEKPKSSKSSASTTPKATPLQSPLVESAEMSLEPTESITVDKGEGASSLDAAQELDFDPPTEMQLADVPEAAYEKSDPAHDSSPLATELPSLQEEQSQQPQQEIPQQPAQPQQVQPQVQPQPRSEVTENGNELAEADMTASMIAKIRITTEEEAKAALAERRRLAREQAEREAELERQRIEAERLAEEERLRKEEEEHRRMEEEQLRLLEEARRSEELRLQQAIEEVKKREEEEKRRKEEELKQKLEKEEAEKKAKEEAEKMRIEMEIRLKKEEEDRQARRKRVEAIMLRTRGKGSTASATTPSKDGEESEENSPPDEAKKVTEEDKFLNSERSHSDANTIPPLVENNKHNGHHNGSIDTVSEINVTNSLLDLGPSGDILELPTGNGKLPETPPFIENSQSHVNDLLS
ncbi:ensconsin isoform X3 [Halyomorpha halys]|uniref:ensconsin isoform X3 n=1 Tax=Halyomorpha halys TaxID=286706 RepID=UPI0006D4C6A6|nr:ensconsin isoform X3 [Halyomorpha halys]